MGRAEELLELHAALDDPADRMSTAEAVIRTVIEFDVAFLAGLPDDAVHRAERRLEMLVRRRDLSTTEATAHLALALLRLRQGGVDGNAAAERHCEQALAVKNVPDSLRRMALAGAIMSREARGLPDEDIHATAAATLPALDHGLESTAASLKAILHPEAVLRAFRAGDSAARLTVGAIALMLRRQGRIGELLDVHAGFGAPAGSNWRAQAQSLHRVEYNLLCAPGLPPEVINEAAVRTRWLMDNYPFKAKEDSQLRSGMEHTLALARLRQGRSMRWSRCAGRDWPPTLARTTAPRSWRRSSSPAGRSASRTRTCSPRRWPCHRTPTWSLRPDRAPTNRWTAWTADGDGGREGRRPQGRRPSR